MSRCRTVRPEVVRLPLSDGDYLDVKKALNAGEYQDLLASVAIQTDLGGPQRIDQTRLGLQRLVANVIGWSLVDDAGRPLPWNIDDTEAARSERLAMLRSLDAASVIEMLAALDAHETQEAARKNGQDGGSKSPAISPSPVAAAGATSGSAP